MSFLGMALGVSGLTQLEAVVSAAMRQQGWTTDPIKGARNEIWCEEVEVGGAQRWVLLYGEQPPPAALAAALAAALDCRVICHRLEVRDAAHPESDEGYWFTCESYTVEPDGARADTGSGLDGLEPEHANFGDLYETGRRMLDFAIHDDPSVLVRLGGVAYSRVPSRLPTRLADLCRQIHAAGAWSAVEIGNRWEAKVVLPDGSRRISILTKAERDAVAAETAIDPA